MSCVYMLTNTINGKRYIGQTNNLERRLREHTYKGRWPINKAIHKYGIENFDVDKLEEDVPLDKIDEAEKFWIKKFNAYEGRDYNLTGGGRTVSGRDHPQAKVDIKTAENILLDRIEKHLTAIELSEKYDISRPVIAEIIKGDYWAVREGNLEHLSEKAPNRLSAPQNGSNNHAGKITIEMALDVLEDRISQETSITKLSNIYDISASTIHKIIQGEHWTGKHPRLQKLINKAPNKIGG